MLMMYVGGNTNIQFHSYSPRYYFTNIPFTIVTALQVLYVSESFQHTGFWSTFIFHGESFTNILRQHQNMGFMGFINTMSFLNRRKEIISSGIVMLNSMMQLDGTRTSRDPASIPKFHSNKVPFFSIKLLPFNFNHFQTSDHLF